MTREYSLDTSICIELIRGQRRSARERLSRAMAEGDLLVISTVVLHELSYGVVRSNHPKRNAEALEIFLSGVDVLDFTADDALAAGEVRANLARLGTPIGPFDVLIAAQALRRKLTLVTCNLREFKRVPGLTLESWTA